MKCPTCNGKKTVQCTVHEVGKEVRQIDLDCAACDGTGKITVARLKIIKRSREIWCRCKSSSNSSYHPDFAGMKHHWTCDDCGKVTQIG